MMKLTVECKMMLYTLYIFVSFRINAVSRC